VSAAGEGSETLAISTFRLDLTMERTQLEGGGGPNNESGSLLSSSLLPSSSWESVDSIIQSAAEGHQASVYALELDATPTQILLTVFSADPDNPGKGSGSGIVVRRSFLGGVVGLHPGGPPSPVRLELDSVTLGAFDIPGYGEYFLRALRDSGDPGLAGQLLIAAKAVQGETGYEYD
jgi:hypothetical protein